MASQTPFWLKLVYRAERGIGSRVEAAVHSDTYFDAVTQINGVKRSVTGKVEGVSKRVWHAANLPAGTDMRILREQLARMERRIVELSKELEEQRDAGEAED